MNTSAWRASVWGFALAMAIAPLALFFAVRAWWPATVAMICLGALACLVFCLLLARAPRWAAEGGFSETRLRQLLILSRAAMISIGAVFVAMTFLLERPGQKLLALVVLACMALTGLVIELIRRTTPIDQDESPGAPLD